jgi:hypothetical protein
MNFIKGATIFCTCRKLMANYWKGYVNCINPECPKFGKKYHVKVTMTPTRRK